MDHRRPAELAAPDDQRVVEQPALLQVLDQRGAGLVGVLAVLLEVVDQVAVLVPGLVEDLHEPHAALDQPAGQQAVVGERRLARLGAVHVEDVLAARWPMSITSGALDCMRKAISNELIRVAISGSPTASSRSRFRAADGVERVALQLAVDAARVGEVQHRVAAGAELDALVDGRQEAAAPVRVAAARALSCRC